MTTLLLIKHTTLRMFAYMLLSFKHVIHIMRSVFISVVIPFHRRSSSKMLHNAFCIAYFQVSASSASNERNVMVKSARVIFNPKGWRVPKPFVITLPSLCHHCHHFVIKEKGLENDLLMEGSQSFEATWLFCILYSFLNDSCTGNVIINIVAILEDVGEVFIG